MSPEVREALEQAVTQKRSLGAVRAIVYAVAQDLPDDMTIQELCDELCIANNQGGESGQ